jgi:AmmeMemoRadiSam system protein B
MLVPHGAYCDSGPLQVSGFDHKQTAGIDSVIIIGTEHASSSTNLVNCSDHTKWRTPFGDVPVNESLLNSIKEFVPVDKTAFMDEHSVENQLPFLQTVVRQPWTMVALSVHGNIASQENLDNLEYIGQKLANLVQAYHAREGNHRVAVIGSTITLMQGPSTENCQLILHAVSRHIFDPKIYLF